jgi:hypothetical protein
MGTSFMAGLVSGPPMGGVLFSLGGFLLPFLVIGSASAGCAILNLFVLRTHEGNGIE